MYESSKEQIYLNNTQWFDRRWPRVGENKKCTWEIEK